MKVMLITVVCGLVDDDNVASALVQTSQVLLVFVRFNWPITPVCQVAADALHVCGFQTEVSFLKDEGWLGI